MGKIQKKLFITGIGTDVGKTVCSAILMRHFQADYWKPIQSGDLDSSDSAKVYDWSGGDLICHPETYRLQLAVSPHESAHAEGITIKLNKFEIPKTSNNIIIEGAGGLMVPLNNENVIIDLIEKLNINVALVVRNYLGCINHTLLSILALQHKNIPLEYVILNGKFPHHTERILLHCIAPETKIIRIPHLKTISRESIAKLVDQMNVQ